MEEEEEEHLLQDRCSENDPPENETLPPVRRDNRIRLDLVITAVAVSLLALAVLFLTRTTHVPPVQQCGRTATDAFSRGCKFDVMAFSWLPPACYDASLTEEFLLLEDWGWYVSPFPRPGRDREPLRLVEQGTQGDLFVHRQYRITQCAFLWRKVQRVLDGTGAQAADTHATDPARVASCMGLADVDHYVPENRSGLQLLSVSFPECRQI